MFPTYFSSHFLLRFVTQVDSARKLARWEPDRILFVNSWGGRRLSGCNGEVRKDSENERRFHKGKLKLNPGEETVHAFASCKYH